MMNTPTYANPIQEFWFGAVFVAQVGLNTFCLIQPPRGQLLVVKSVVAASTTGLVRATVSSNQAFITGSLPTTVRVTNPIGDLSIARAGSTVLAPPAQGFLLSRTNLRLNAVVESVSEQFFIIFNATANEGFEVGVQGLLVPSEFNIEQRYLL